MGNVVRGTFADGSSGNVLPASQELEASIDRWLCESENEARLVEVWALVSPSIEKWYLSPTVLGKAINAGSHLHRVLSGGGGWGNRQGLLALDLATDFHDTCELPSTDISETVDPEVEKRRNLGQIVSPGDTVQFYVRLEHLSGVSSFAAPAIQNLRNKSYEFNRLTSIVFGTVPSTIDAMPAPSTTEVDHNGYSPCIYAWGHFGMLSEQGISLTTTAADGQRSQTKIDVPHSMISLSGQGYLTSIQQCRHPTCTLAFRGDDSKLQSTEVASTVPKKGLKTGRLGEDPVTSAPRPMSEYMEIAQMASETRNPAQGQTLQQTPTALPLRQYKFPTVVSSRQDFQMESRAGQGDISGQDHVGKQDIVSIRRVGASRHVKLIRRNIRAFEHLFKPQPGSSLCRQSLLRKHVYVQLLHSAQNDAHAFQKTVD
ncbi:MAG: hypothetical protein Q9170_003860 [Blastenia crenularia]